MPADQRRLLRLYHDLSPGARQSLLSFAEFLLQQRASPEPEQTPPSAQPGIIRRPESESVVAAMRRLAQSFPMLDKGELLHEASALMSAHVLHGRPPVEVINGLEALFRRHDERRQSDSDLGRTSPQ